MLCFRLAWEKNEEVPTDGKAAGWGWLALPSYRETYRTQMTMADITQHMNEYDIVYVTLSNIWCLYI